jgi:hypothetical protein
MTDGGVGLALADRGLRLFEAKEPLTVTAF